MGWIVLVLSLDGCHLLFPYSGGADGGVHDALPDGCLPIPAHQARGKYSGTWKGSMSCPGLAPWDVDGQLTLELSPAGSPASFKVAGTMTGVISATYSFSTSLNGSMGCSKLTATMAEITVNVDGYPYRLNGSIEGTFLSSKAVPRGFSKGKWTAEAKIDNCTASGTWTAAGQ